MDRDDLPFSLYFIYCIKRNLNKTVARTGNLMVHIVLARDQFTSSLGCAEPFSGDSLVSVVSTLENTWFMRDEVRGKWRIQCSAENRTYFIVSMYR
jgi:hypothetical protein